MDRSSGREIEVHPDIFDALDAMVGNGFKSDGQVLIRIAGGNVVQVDMTAPARVLRYFSGRHVTR